MKNTLTLCLFALLIFTAQFARAEPIKVVVSIAPQKYFVEKIGGDLVDVSVMVKPGATPATYEPKPRQMVALTKTKVYFAIGVPFERVWLQKIAATNSRMIVVHTEAGIKRISMEAHPHNDEAEHYHEKVGYHDREETPEHLHHGIQDPHVWLSPPLVMLQARNILQALISVDPGHRSFYEKHYKSFIIELVDLDRRLRSTFSRYIKGIEFMVFHPSWGYFADAYGLEQVSIEVEGKEPKPAELMELISYAKEKRIKVIFVQPQFSSQSAQTIATGIGGQLVFVDPLAADWANNLLDVATKIGAALM